MNSQFLSKHYVIASSLLALLQIQPVLAQNNQGPADVFYQSVQGSLTNPGAGWKSQYSAADAKGIIESTFSTYLSEHPELDAASCTIVQASSEKPAGNMTQTANGGYSIGTGTKLSSPIFTYAWLIHSQLDPNAVGKKADIEAKLKAKDPKTGRLIISSKDDFKAWFKSVVQQFQANQEPVAVEIAVQALAKNYSMTQSEIENFFYNECRLPRNSLKLYQSESIPGSGSPFQYGASGTVDRFLNAEIKCDQKKAEPPAPMPADQLVQIEWYGAMDAQKQAFHDGPVYSSLKHAADNIPDLYNNPVFTKTFSNLEAIQEDPKIVEMKNTIETETGCLLQFHVEIRKNLPEIMGVEARLNALKSAPAEDKFDIESRIGPAYANIGYETHFELSGILHTPVRGTSEMNSYPVNEIAEIDEFSFRSIPVGGYPGEKMQKYRDALTYLLDKVHAGHIKCNWHRDVVDDAPSAQPAAAPATDSAPPTGPAQQQGTKTSGKGNKPAATRTRKKR